MRVMNPSAPCGEVRASARAAALSDAISVRWRRSPTVTLSFRRRWVVEARDTSLRTIVTTRDRSGFPSKTTAAVITFVMLAMERSSSEFCSQRISFVSGS
jgi:hypothetical protein